MFAEFAKPATKEKKPRHVKVKLFYSGSELRSLIREFKNEKHDFDFSFTGYTAFIKNFTQKIDYFCIKENNKSPFELTAKIKSDIKNSNIYVDKIASHNVKYFKLNGLKPCNLKEVYNIDINNAYPTSLHKLGFITDDLLNFLDGIEKIKKLKAIGQIATRKMLFKFRNGVEICKPELVENEDLRAVWFAICQDVGEVIDLTRRSIKSFLFFWFDGVYFTDITEAALITEIINGAGYECKLETLKDFKVTEDFNNLDISYKKPKKNGKFEIKTFCLPKCEALVYS